MQAHRIAAVLAALTLVAPGCGSDAENGNAGFMVRDSLGIELVTNTQPDSAVGLREVLRVGVVDGDRDHEFEAIRTITVDSAGGFWVVDRGEAVRHYGPDGRYTGSLGGRGNGPGESRMYYSVTLNGGRVLLFGTPGVLQLFGGDGELLSSVPPDLSGPFTSPVGVADGQWILHQRDYPDDGRQVLRSEVTLLRADALDGPRQTIRRFPGELARAGGGGEFGRASWFHGNPAFGVDARGRIFVSDTLQYRIETYDLDSRLIRVLQRSVEPRRFDPAWLREMEGGFEAAQRDLNFRRGGTVDRESLARQMASATPDPVPAQLFFIEDILVGPEGELWVERADRHPRPAMRAVAHQYGYIRHAWLPGWEAPRIFDVFDADGRYRGTVQLPEDFAPMAIAQGRVYGVHYDEFDVERVVVYDISSSVPPVREEMP